MTQGRIFHDLVAVSPAPALAQHVPLFDQLGHDPVGGALGDPNRRGDIAQADARVMSDADEDMGVIREEVPASHGGGRSLLLIS